MKSYLVTGASRGIGMATALNLLNGGNKVIGTYNKNKTQADDLEQAHENLQMVQVDLSSYESIDKLVNALSENLDGIINAAGIFEEVNHNDYNPSSVEMNFKVNAFAPLYLILKLANRLNSNASIVNISSTDSKVGSESGIGYAASKAAVESFTKSLTLCLASKQIRVNAIAPGWIGDGMQAPEELLKIAKDYNPLNKLGRYEDIANIIEFLLSDNSAYINGTIISADGGDEVKSYVLDQENKL